MSKDKINKSNLVSIDIVDHKGISSKQTLEETILLNPKEIISIGYTDDDKFFIRSSDLSNKDALWLLELARLNVMEV